MQKKLLAKYTNGNTHVAIFEDGTKIREHSDTPIPKHPESIDVKITNYCDMGCKYCHEESTMQGKHADLDALLETLSVLPPGVEIAIGGGNPLSHPGLIGFLGALKAKGLIANVTVNQGHLARHYDLLVDLLRDNLTHGLGVSIINSNFKAISNLLGLTNNLVYHVIAGVNQVTVLDQLLALPNPQCKVLVLGYKVFGFGIKHYSKDTYANLKNWYRKIPKYLTKCIMSFDNLAIKQLQIERLLTEDAWARLYMGDDFEFTMYIDAVTGTFAPSSTSKNRVPMGISLLEYFTKGR